MSDPWAVSIPVEHAAAAAPLRAHSHVEVCIANERLWLRGMHWSDELDQSFRRILGAERYRRLDDEQIAPRECILPIAVLPKGTWTPLREWLQPAAPTTVFPASDVQRATLRLVRDTIERPANLLETGFRAWHDYAVGAPKLRLDRLSFAVSDDGRVLVRGEPLPPLPGTCYVETKGIAAPVGWMWSPAVDADVLRQAIGLAEGDIALLTLSTSHPHPGPLPRGGREGEGVLEICDVIESDDFVRATRSAVRLTAKELGHVS